MKIIFSIYSIGKGSFHWPQYFSHINIDSHVKYFKKIKTKSRAYNTYWTSCWWKHNLQGQRNVHDSSPDNMGRVITDKVAVIVLPSNQSWGTAASSGLSCSWNVNWYWWSTCTTASSSAVLSSLKSVAGLMPGLLERTMVLECDASLEPS